MEEEGKEKGRGEKVKVKEKEKKEKEGKGVEKGKENYSSNALYGITPSSILENLFSSF